MPIPKYPQIVVNLSECDGSFIAIVGRIQDALRQHNIPDVEVRKFTSEAITGGAMNLLAVAERWISVE